MYHDDVRKKKIAGPYKQSILQSNKSFDHDKFTIARSAQLK